MKDIWNKDQETNPHEAFYLKLDSEKARRFLNWEPKWNLETALDYTFDWYEKSFSIENVKELSLSQIGKFQET